jgi:polyribonucleotide nucleotidyltransferase
MRSSLLDAHLRNGSSDSSGDRAIRCDGRAFDELREITAALDVLPSVHGSGLFRRGNTEVRG